jgi:hypothetical protein
MASSDREQVEIGRRLQTRLLEYFEGKLDDKTISPTDVSTLTRLLKDNGWSLDPSQLPDAIRGLVKLDKHDEKLEGDRVLDIAEARARRG